MAQSLSMIYLHTVFSTKHRRWLITPDIEQELYAYICGIIRNMNTIPVAINGIADHIHILHTLPRTMTVAKYIQTVKANSSRWIKTKGSEFEDFAWQGGYGTFSVDRFRVEIVINYIKRQKQHHRVKSFKSEITGLYDEAGIKYDERYLWD